MVTDMNYLEQFSPLFVSIKVTSANAFRKLSILKLKHNMINIDQQLQCDYSPRLLL